MINRFARLFFLFFLLFASCQAQPAPPQPSPLVEAPPWRYTDLRLIKAPGSQPPSQTLAALYTRPVGTELQIRVDLLDFNTQPDFDLYLALDTRPGGVRQLPITAQAGIDWDALITLYASGEVTAVDAQGIEIPGLKLFAVQDASQDSVVFSLDSNALGLGRTGYSIQVFVTAAGSRNSSDSLGPVRSDAPTPAPATLLLAFWNTFPADNPAQALRFWNGAHTGPFGGRHGLANLLNAAHADKVPLTLVDLKTPTSLSALDTIGRGSDLLHTLVNESLLSLPDVLPVASPQSGSLLKPPEWALQRLLSEGRTTAQAFQLPASPNLYSPLAPSELPAELLAPYQLLLTDSDKTEGSSGTPLVCQRYMSWMALSLPTRPTSSLSADQVEASQQATLNGLSLDTRRALLTLAAQNAASGANTSDPCSGAILLLGGNLAYSAWGEPFMAQSAMDYIAGHPWTRALRLEELLGGRPAGPLETQEPVPAQGRQAASSGQISLSNAQAIPHEPDGKTIPSGLSTAQIEQRLLNALQTAPGGPLEQAAWQMYTSLLRPIYPLSAAIYPLRAAYLGQVGIWLAADQWAADPQTVCAAANGSPCIYAQDVDWDGEPEYILASSSYFGVFDRGGGYLAAAFAIDKNGPHQIIGPSWQFSVGLADPSTWQADQGIAGDPRALRGAFSDLRAGFAIPSWEAGSVQAGQGELSFATPDGRLHKTIRLTQQGFTAQYESADQLKVQMPLTIDPWNRFSLKLGAALHCAWQRSHDQPAGVDLGVGRRRASEPFSHWEQPERRTL